MWSPPRSRTKKSRLAGLVLLCLTTGLGGCALNQATLNAMLDQEAKVKSRLVARDAVPVFDEPAVPRIAAKETVPGGIAAPRPFAWERVGQTTGKRPFQRISAGQDGFRTLVVGSVGGNDPAAVQFVDELAKYLHTNSMILAGFEATVIRTLNPDGESNRKLTNEAGVYINRQFSRTVKNQESSVEIPAEVRFFLQQVDTVQPQRIIHIRSVQGQKGMIAASANASASAKEVASWLGFEFVELPGKASAGTMERYFAEQGETQIVMFGIPDNLKGDDLWDSCSDAVLNLLKDDLTRREVVDGKR